MSRNNFTRLAAVLAAVGVSALATSSALADVTVNVAGATINGTPPVQDGLINGADFQDAFFQPAGTGFINPFLSVDRQGNSASPPGVEQGYNTSINPPPMDAFNGGSAHTDNLLISSIPVVHSTLTGQDYWVFSLDVNQVGNGPIALHQFQVFLSSSIAPNNLTATSYQLNYPGATLAYEMNGALPTLASGNVVYAHSTHGSGSGDMFAFVPVPASLGGNTYAVAYCVFGPPPADLLANDGFEEWGLASGSPGLPPLLVPEPTTLIAGALLLLPFGASTLRIIRRNRKA